MAPLVVETARRVPDYTGGTLVMPMTVLVEQYWREISSGLATYSIPVRHFALHAEAARACLHAQTTVVDTTHVTAAQAASRLSR